jgi:YVTN family beta-propeller protein
MPVAAGIQSVARGNKAYVANIVSGQVSVFDLNSLRHLRDIPVTLTPDCRSGAEFDVFDSCRCRSRRRSAPTGASSRSPSSR